MSVLETMVAVRDVGLDDVVAATIAICADAGITTRWHPQGTREWGRHDVAIYDAPGPWVVVGPHYIVSSEDMALALSRRLRALATATSIYEDVFWTHHLVDEGRTLDRFCNIPGYFGRGEYGPEWRGDPDLVADVLGVERRVAGRYLRQWSVTTVRLRMLVQRPPRPLPGDDAHLLDGWVTRDLWRRFGIEVPDAPAGLVPLSSDESSMLSEHLRRAAG